MTKQKHELSISSRYIHTGNSGVQLSVVRDVKNVDRAVLVVENGAFGAFSTSMEIRGNDYKGMTPVQLEDLALMLLDAAHKLSRGGRISYEHRTPRLISEDGHRSSGNSPSSIQELLRPGDEWPVCERIASDKELQLFAAWEAAEKTAAGSMHSQSPRQNEKASVNDAPCPAYSGWSTRAPLLNKLAIAARLKKLVDARHAQASNNFILSAPKRA